MNRQFPTGRLIASFIIATVLFIIIFVFASSISYLNYQKIENQNNIILVYLEEMDALLLKQNCNNEILLKSSEILDQVGGRLNLLETRFGKKDPRVLEQKSLYTAIELKHLEIIKQFQSQCNEDFITILFFYSNNKPFNKASENVGRILSTFKRKDLENRMIYSFDYNLNIPPINNLKQGYNLTIAPIIIVNNNEPEQINNINDLDKYT